MAISIDDKALDDPNLRDLGIELGAPPLFEIEIAVGVMARVWKACIARAKEIFEELDGLPPLVMHPRKKKMMLPEIALDRAELEKIGKRYRRADLADLLIRAGLGTQREDGVAIAGTDVPSRCWWIAEKLKAAKAGGKATQAKWQAARQADGGPPSLAGASERQADAKPAPGPLTPSPSLSTSPEETPLAPAPARVAMGSSPPIAEASGVTQPWPKVWGDLFFAAHGEHHVDRRPNDWPEQAVQAAFRALGPAKLVERMRRFFADDKRPLARKTLEMFARDMDQYTDGAMKARGSPTSRRYEPDPNADYGNGPQEI